jgi:uncharacterized protein with HEPN domain
MTSDDRDWFHLRQILRMIAMIDYRLNGMSKTAFTASRDEIDLTAFRLQVIGEAAKKVSAPLKKQHSNVEWSKIVAMRNFIAHDYEGIEIERVWIVATAHLKLLDQICRSELGAEGLLDI